MSSICRAKFSPANCVAVSLVVHDSKFHNLHLLERAMIRTDGRHPSKEDSFAMGVSA